MVSIIHRRQKHMLKGQFTQFITEHSETLTVSLIVASSQEDKFGFVISTSENELRLCFFNALNTVLALTSFFCHIKASANKTKPLCTVRHQRSNDPSCAASLDRMNMKQQTFTFTSFDPRVDCVGNDPSGLTTLRCHKFIRQHQPIITHKDLCRTEAGGERKKATERERNTLTGVLCSRMPHIPTSSSVGRPPGPYYATGRCLWERVKVKEHRVHSVGTCSEGLWDRWRPS